MHYIFIYLRPWDFSSASVVKNLLANTGDTGDAGLIAGLGRSPGVTSDNPFQYSCLGNAMTEEPGGLQSMGSRRFGHDWASEHARMHPWYDTAYRTLYPTSVKSLNQTLLLKLCSAYENVSKEFLMQLTCFMNLRSDFILNNKWEDKYQVMFVFGCM